MLDGTTSSIAVAVGMSAGFLIDQERRWRRSDQSEPPLFLPGGQPAMQVRGIPTGRAAGPSAVTV
jgi:hypothetical protein